MHITIKRNTVLEIIEGNAGWLWLPNKKSSIVLWKRSNSLVEMFIN